MGHERVGFLPKSKSWNQVVEYIHNYSETSTDVSKIAEYTLKNIRHKFLTLNNDASFLASFKWYQVFILFLIAASSDRVEDP